MTVKVVWIAQGESVVSGLKVYTLGPTTVVSILAGVQVPATPFNDVNGNAEAVPFSQILAIGSNVGRICPVTVTQSVAGKKQLKVGVKV